MSSTNNSEKDDATCTATTASSPRAQLSAQDTVPEDMFVRHKVSKLDTLAGLAVRYHVTVSDIKRANGLLSDSAMFARDTLLIPTKPLPVGAEYSTWAGMIVMQYGKLRAKERCPRVADAKFNNLAAPKTSIDQLRGYYSTSPGASPKSTSDEEDEQGSNYGWRSSREVELMTRNATSGAASSYAEERLRRRRQADEDDPGDPPGAAAAPPTTTAGPAAGAGGEAGGVMSYLQPAAGRLATWATQVQQRVERSMQPQRPQLQQQQQQHDVRRPPGRRKEGLLDRLKKVASQPALGLGSAPVSIAAAADDVIGTGQGQPSSTNGRAGEAGSSRLPNVQSAYNLLSRPKEGSKAD